MKKRKFLSLFMAVLFLLTPLSVFAEKSKSGVLDSRFMLNEYGYDKTDGVWKYLLTVYLKNVSETPKNFTVWSGPFENMELFDLKSDPAGRKWPVSSSTLSGSFRDSTGESFPSNTPDYFEIHISSLPPGTSDGFGIGIYSSKKITSLDIPLFATEQTEDQFQEYVESQMPKEIILQEAAKLTYDALAKKYKSYKVSVEPVPVSKDNKDSINTDANKTVFTLGKKQYLSNGVSKEAAAAPYTKNGRTMLPVRALAESLGLEVKWDASTKTATFTGNDQVAVVKLGANVMKVNDKDVKLNANAEMKNGAIFIELKSLADAFGIKINWDNSTKSAIIQK